MRTQTDTFPLPRNASSRKITVGVADMAISASPGEVIMTHSLGSCLGITIYDPIAQVAGMLHLMLPLSKVSPEKAANNPYIFADTGIPRFFDSVYAKGAKKSRLVVKVAGGASPLDDSEFFEIGKRNLMVMRKLFWRNRILIDAEDVGDRIARTLHLAVDTGHTWITSCGEEWDL